MMPPSATAQVENLEPYEPQSKLLQGGYIGVQGLGFRV